MEYCDTCGAPWVDGKFACQPETGPGLMIRRLDDEPMEMYRLTGRTYVNADKSKIVAEHDPEVASLLGVEGTLIPRELAIRLGLAEAKAVKPAEDKAVHGPRETKFTLAETRERFGTPEQQLERALILLGEAGIANEDISHRSDFELLNVKGVGPKLLELVREHYPYQEPVDDDDARSDS